MSNVPVIVTVDTFPASSVAVTTMVLFPSVKVKAFEKLPFVTEMFPWSAPFNLILISTLVLCESLVLPCTVNEELLVINSSAGPVCLG